MQSKREMSMTKGKFWITPPTDLERTLIDYSRINNKRMLLVQLVNAGVEIDPRDVTVTIATISNLLNPHPVSLSSIPNPSNLDVALSTRASETELQQKLETADLSIEAVTKYLNANVKNFPTDYFKAGNNIGNTGFNVNNFPSDYPDAAVLAKLDVALSTRATEATLATLFKAGQAIGALPAGTNNIGDVDVLSLPATVIAGMTSLPAGTNNIGDVDVLTLPTITQSTKHDAKTYKTAVFDASASGNLVAASTTGKVIKLHALIIQAQGTVVVNLNNGSGGASLMEWSFQAREGAVIPMANAPAYWAITGVNTALYVTLSAAVVVTITAVYSDDDAS